MVDRCSLFVLCSLLVARPIPRAAVRAFNALFSS